MKKKIFEGFGSEIFEQGNKYFVKFDSGGIAVKMQELEITKQEADKFRLSKMDAYEVILKAQQRGEMKKKKSCRWF